MSWFVIVERKWIFSEHFDFLTPYGAADFQNPRAFLEECVSALWTPHAEKAMRFSTREEAVKTMGALSEDSEIKILEEEEVIRRVLGL